MVPAHRPGWWPNLGHRGDGPFDHPGSQSPPSGMHHTEHPLVASQGDRCAVGGEHSSPNSGIVTRASPIQRSPVIEESRPPSGLLWGPPGTAIREPAPPSALRTPDRDDVGPVASDYPVELSA